MESFLLNGLYVSAYSPQTSVRNTGIHTFIGKTVEPFFENILYQSSWKVKNKELIIPWWKSSDEASCLL